MRTAPNGFRERPKQKPEEIEFDIRPVTAQNIRTAQNLVDQKAGELSDARLLLNAEMRSLLSERGIAEATPLRITDTKPPRLVLNVLSYVKPEKLTKKKQ